MIDNSIREGCFYLFLYAMALTVLFGVLVIVLIYAI